MRRARTDLSGCTLTRHFCQRQKCDGDLTSGKTGGSEGRAQFEDDYHFRGYNVSGFLLVFFLSTINVVGACHLRISTIRAAGGRRIGATYRPRSNFCLQKSAGGLANPPAGGARPITSKLNTMANLIERWSLTVCSPYICPSARVCTCVCVLVFLRARVRRLFVWIRAPLVRAFHMFCGSEGRKRESDQRS